MSQTSQLKTGWVIMKWGCKGRSRFIHYMNGSLSSLCGLYKVTLEEQKNLLVLDEPRMNKVCSRCLHNVELLGDKNA